MGLIYFLIAFIQPILLFTPEMVTITGGSLTLGPLKGFIIGYLGILSGIITMYFIGRYSLELTNIFDVTKLQLVLAQLIIMIMVVLINHLNKRIGVNVI